ncbi:unannotated protein [freshwater metagenome]|uniref:Unannotated protein n=1 Tax=freshwater metagenome TaxID=449393 RepID=A0A6J6DJ17_9ZZZZ
MDADGARHLCDSTDRLFNVARSNHHEVVELVDHYKDVRKAVVFDTHLGLIDNLATIKGRVVAIDVAETTFRKKVVATFHFLHGPRQRICCLLRICHDLCEQMRKAVVLTEFHTLGVDENQTNLIRCRAHEDRRKQ